MNSQDESIDVHTPATIEEIYARYERDRDLRTLKLRDGQYDGIEIPGALLSGVDLRRSNFQDSDLSGAELTCVRATRALFTKADLSGADLRSSNFTDAQFNAATLDSADFRGCTLSPDTNLKDASVKKLKMDRRTLSMLGASRGGMTDAALAQLEIDDDRAKLTTHFGGFWTRLHLMAVVIFALPFVLFVLRKIAGAAFAPCTQDCTSLGSALLRYMLTGGNEASANFTAISIAVLLLIYNVLRGTLVYKEHSLALADKARGIPQDFQLTGYWWLAYRGTQALFWVNLTLLLTHIYQLFSIQVHR